ncbi:MAG: DNA-directed RNA polymerase subunit alpha [Chlamydiota bacterium]|jgi:DNA-directed RNA polymerase subunit alpha
MTVMYGKFEMPEKIKIEDADEGRNFAKFIVEPFERGFGHTIGNSLRRIMLSSLEAPSLVSIRIEGVPHEYTAIDGITEDMTHIVLNLKGSLLRKLPLSEDSGSTEMKLLTKILEVTHEDLEKGNGQYNVTFKDLMGTTDFEIVNPDHHIFTVTKPMTKRIDIRVGISRGYIPSERHDFERMVDEIVIDSSFSPVKLVNYYVENTRVGQDTDLDKLIFEVKTDGRITPQEALAFAAQVASEHLNVFQLLSKPSITFDKGEVEINKDRDEILSKLALRINEIELSVRSTNCLVSANIDTIGELVVMPESDMLRFRNFGKKSLTEIKQKLEEMGLSLGMDLSKYGITKDNIKEVIQKYKEEEKLGSES